MAVELDHIKQVMAEADCLFTEADVEGALQSMASEITERLADSNPIVYSVMNGGLIISGKLLPKLPFPMEVGYLHATRYRNKLSGGELFWKARAEHSLVGRSVLIIDDILDEGHTLAAIVEYCRDAGAEHVYTAVLLDKQHDRKAYPGMRADFTGLDVEDRYIFGYGLDYKGYWRNAAGIFALKGH
ncbi:hypoxanthine-guanine phosphoribosyltransferase [Halopseudomonas oceani]|jgi:hypoxanthine phosphoribosyltransferase|uniref:Hypoxanthine-guanine phosphoribosyltransferase n=1 Tax=Halopseudomonas oceani TaxID=1708783 RepID=A0A2P4ET46_9GAMM|nr:hypoxanthine-guanine phosphoribosyltransferase [Halopseudomonas oceani]POB02459.1 hypoxanthine-guanine phosphoribosyltransferase [Halopseudomonas oceani]GGE48021.1 hypoxanthine-guanine phosphoribosyltransferase [Halopseudomonas oceani]